MTISKKLQEAFDYLFSQIDDGYVDVSTAHEELEVRIIELALLRLKERFETGGDRSPL